jgi:hypothetical protein
MKGVLRWLYTAAATTAIGHAGPPARGVHNSL